MESGGATNRWQEHGAYSRKHLTPDENEDVLVKLECMYVAHYRPVSELDLREVHKLAALDWRLQRYGRMEAETLTHHGYESEQEGLAPYAGAGWECSMTAPNTVPFKP